MGTTINLHQRVRIELTAKGKDLLDGLKGNGDKNFIEVEPGIYESELYDVLTVFGRQMRFRKSRNDALLGHDDLIKGCEIEIMPRPDNDRAVSDDAEEKVAK